MPILPKHNIKRPWIKSNIQQGKRQTNEDNQFYHTKEWKAVSYVMSIEEPLCRECKKKNNRVKASTITDHIIQVRKGGSKYDKSNLQRLCDSCHASKSGKEGH